MGFVMGSQDQSSPGDLIDVWLWRAAGREGSGEGCTAAPQEEILQRAARLRAAIAALFMHTHKRLHASH